MEYYLQIHIFNLCKTKLSFFLSSIFLSAIVFAVEHIFLSNFLNSFKN